MSHIDSNTHPGLHAGERGGEYAELPQKTDGVFAFSRTKGDNQVIVAVNFNTEPAAAAFGLEGEYTNAFTGETLSGIYATTLPAGGYIVMSR